MFVSGTTIGARKAEQWSPMEYRMKLVAIAAAAEEAGYPRVNYPLEHSLVYFLSQGRGQLKFSNYIFNMNLYPSFLPADKKKGPIRYPHSLELRDDLGYLETLGYVDAIRQSMPSYSLGPRGKDEKDKILGRYDSYVQETGEMSYRTLVSKVKEGMNNPRKMLEECYRWYISTL